MDTSRTRFDYALRSDGAVYLSRYQVLREDPVLRLILHEFGATYTSFECENADDYTMHDRFWTGAQEPDYTAITTQILRVLQGTYNTLPVTATCVLQLPFPDEVRLEITQFVGITPGAFVLFLHRTMRQPTARTSSLPAFLVHDARRRHAALKKRKSTDTHGLMKKRRKRM